MFWKFENEAKRDAYLAECILFDEGFYTAPKFNQTSPVLHIIKKGNKAVRVCKKAFLGVFGLHRSGRWRVEELEREMVRTKQELKSASPLKKRRSGPPYVVKREPAPEAAEDQYDFPEGDGPVTRRSLKGRQPPRGKAARGRGGSSVNSRYTKLTRAAAAAKREAETEDGEEQDEQAQPPAEEAANENEAQPEDEAAQSNQAPPPEAEGENDAAQDPHALFTDPPEAPAKRPSAIRAKKSVRESRYMDMMNKVEHVEQHIDVYVTGPLEDYKGKYSGEEELINWSEDDIRHWYNHYVQKYCVEQEYDAVSWELYRKLFKKATCSEGDNSELDHEDLMPSQPQDDPNFVRLVETPEFPPLVTSQRVARARGGVRTRGGHMTRQHEMATRGQQQEDEEIVYEGEIPGDQVVERDEAEGEEEDIADEHLQQQELVQGEVTQQLQQQVVTTQEGTAGLVVGMEVIPQQQEQQQVVQVESGSREPVVIQQFVTYEPEQQQQREEYTTTQQWVEVYQQEEPPAGAQAGQPQEFHQQNHVTTSAPAQDQIEAHSAAQDPGLMPPAPHQVVAVVGNSDQPAEEIESYVTAAHALQKLSQVPVEAEQPEVIGQQQEQEVQEQAEVPPDAASDTQEPEISPEQPEDDAGTQQVEQQMEQHQEEKLEDIEAQEETEIDQQEEEAMETEETMKPVPEQEMEQEKIAGKVHKGEHPAVEGVVSNGEDTHAQHEEICHQEQHDVITTDAQS